MTAARGCSLPGTPLLANRTERADLSNTQFTGLDFDAPHFIDCTAAHGRFDGGVLTNSRWDDDHFTR